MKQAGSLGALLRHFPMEKDFVRLASPAMRELQDDLTNYHRAMLEVSRAAVGRWCFVAL